MHNPDTRFMVGLDVGSTTVKAVVSERDTDRVVWQDYQRHETKQPEKVLDFLKRMEADTGIDRHNTRIFLTGSGGGGIAEQIGAKFVQEVTTVSLAVEKLHPEVYSVVELGGLYVIGAGRHDSRRVDDQLRGRAGRQGLVFGRERQAAAQTEF